MDIAILTLILSSISTLVIGLYGILKNIKHIKACCCESDCIENNSSFEENLHSS